MSSRPQSIISLNITRKISAEASGGSGLPDSGISGEDFQAIRRNQSQRLYLSAEDSGSQAAVDGGARVSEVAQLVGFVILLIFPQYLKSYRYEPE